MSNILTLKAKGLNTSPNELDREEGSLIEANNIIIRRDGVIEQARGFKLWGNSLPSSTQRAKQLIAYRDRILRQYDSKLQYDTTGEGNFVDFSGSYSETETGLRLKSIEANGNLYFTSSEGIKKISAKTSDDFTQSANYITQAGGIKAVDFELDIVYTPGNTTGFLTQDSAVAYRIVWATKDKNNNLILGAPSQREIIANPLSSLLISDFARLLSILDSFENTPLTSARINDKDYLNSLKLSLSATASDVRTNLIALTAKLDNDIFLADQSAVAPLQISSAVISSGVCTITFSSGNPSNYLSTGSKIFLSGFSPITGTLDGAQEVSTVTATTLTFNTTATGAVTITTGEIHYNEYRSITQPSEPAIPSTNNDWVALQDYLSSIAIKLQNEPSDIIATGTDATNIDDFTITNSASVELTITIPDDVTSDYFYQIYRSNQAIAEGVISIDDVSPDDELQLVYEAYPTNSELLQKQISVIDNTPDDFRGANLYTNASTGEGILQANDIPPFATDVNRFKGSIFYSNTKTKQRLSTSLLGVVKLIDDYNNSIIPTVTIANTEGSSNVYEFVTGTQQITDITTVADVSDSLNGKYFFINSMKNSYYVYFETTTATDPLVSGKTAIKVNIDTNDTATVVAQKLRDKLSTYLFDFSTVTSVSNTVTITDANYGESEVAVDNDTTFSFSVTLGRGEKIAKQQTLVTAIAASLYVSSGTADYFTLNNVNDLNKYYFYFDVGTATDPALAGYTAIPITLNGTETASQVATLIAAASPSTFTAVADTDEVTFTCNTYGKCTNSVENVSDVGFQISTLITGGLNVLLSPDVSPAKAVDETARSFIRIINKNESEVASGFYISTVNDVPGKILLEGRTLNDSAFYLLSNNSNTGSSFNPDISPSETVTTITSGAITTFNKIAHGLVDGDEIFITATNTTPKINGIFEVSYIDADNFSIDFQTTSSGTQGAYITLADCTVSENEVKPNRIYYSKYQQPESVPIVNYFDVGAEEKSILRIFPLRDSLFVFKQDGLYRISGESIPFSVALFDSSVILLAADSICVVDNLIYCWTNQGIQVISESGTQTISRPIDNLILKLASSNYVNFQTATWGIGYGSDSSVTMWTVSSQADEVATIGFRYNTLTNSWTTLTKSTTCGIIFDVDNKMYLGMADISYIEQERKTFSRLDYAGREFETELLANKYQGTVIKLPSVSDFSIGDSLVQEQFVGIYEFNALLAKLDIDPQVSDTDYETTLQISAGQNLRTKLDALASKLDNDTGVVQTDYASTIASKSGTITAISSGKTPTLTKTNHGLLTGRKVVITGSNSTPSIDGEYTVTVVDANNFKISSPVTIAGTTANFLTDTQDFGDINTCFNAIVSKLNNDNGVGFNNYKPNTTTTLQEAVILKINQITKEVTLNRALEFMIGKMVVYKAIQSSYTYSPNTFGDPLNLKHLRQVTLMMDNRAITTMRLEFKTDLKPSFIGVDFSLDGNGIYGHDTFGEGFFGGASNAAPIRTLIPRDCQRCRYLTVRFKHNVARESYQINGMTITGNVGLSERAYR